MKLTYVALFLTLIMVGLSAFLVFQGSQDRARVDALEAKVAAAEQDAASAAAAVDGKISQIEQQAGAQKGELVALQAEKEAIEAERLMLNSKIGELKAEAEEAKVEANIAKQEAAGVAAESLAVENSKLTSFQKSIRDAASIGNVREYNKDWAFVVINAGADRGIEEGDEFVLRREHYLVGRVKVSNVDPESAVANLEADSIPIGMSILPGDAVIKEPLQ